MTYETSDELIERVRHDLNPPILRRRLDDAARTPAPSTHLKARGTPAAQ